METKKDQARRFQQVLSYDIQKRIAILMFETYSKVQSAARTQEHMTTKRRKDHDQRI